MKRVQYEFIFLCPDKLVTTAEKIYGIVFKCGFTFQDFPHFSQAPRPPPAFCTATAELNAGGRGALGICYTFYLHLDTQHTAQAQYLVSLIILSLAKIINAPCLLGVHGLTV